MSDADAVVLVPVKPLAVAKSRLRSVTGDDTADLVLAMAMDTLAAAVAAVSAQRVVVITDDPAVSAAAGGLGVEVMADRAAAGLNAALIEASEDALDCLVVAQPADCPCLGADDIDRLIAACRARQDRVFVPDAFGTGTTSLAAPAGVGLRPRYGPGSRSAHRSDGAYELVGAPWIRMRRDVDTWGDLLEATALGVGVHTQRWLELNRD